MIAQTWLGKLFLVILTNARVAIAPLPSKSSSFQIVCICRVVVLLWGSDRTPNESHILVTMKRHAAIDLRQKHRVTLADFGVESLAVFGSVARDEAQDSSDLDVLVEFNGKVTFDRYMDLKFYLEDLLGVSVDVVTKKMLRDEIQATVEQEAIRVT